MIVVIISFENSLCYILIIILKVVVIDETLNLSESSKVEESFIEVMMYFYVTGERVLAYVSSML